MTKKHKHYEAIIAFANGAKIEVWDTVQRCWSDIQNPMWIDEWEYRVKPVEYPKTQLSGKVLDSIWYAEDDEPEPAHVRVANYVIETFITSGQMDEYLSLVSLDKIKERDNA